MNLEDVNKLLDAGFSAAFIERIMTPAAPADPAAPAAPAGAGDPVTSPMPGTILDVRCQQGQTVKNGDILFILEAMKMENEIFANKDGTVTSVCVSKGASVDTGSVLCTIS